MSVAVILGSAYDEAAIPRRSLRPHKVETPFGAFTLFQLEGYPEGFLSFRHGLPHRWLPNQIPYRAQAAALHRVGCRALLVTSSVGVLDPELPLDTPMMVEDLLTLDNRLPDGSACTMHPTPSARQGHLVLDEGLISQALTEQVEARLKDELGCQLGPRVTFGYAQGPRTKTAAENTYFSRLGAQVDSMTLAPEVVLANELEIPSAALVVGHKYSIAGVYERLDRESTDQALRVATELITPIARSLLERPPDPVTFGNRIYRY